jgi:hypothetical protein
MKFATTIRSYAIILGLSIAFSAFALAQIPNAGFETWSGISPTGWLTDNAPGVDTVVFKTTDAHSGTYAVEGVATTLFSAVVSPGLSSLFTWTTRSATFSGYYKYSPVGGDTLLIAAVLAKSSTAIAAGILRTTVAQSSYTQFSITLQYLSSVTPDSGGIDVAILRASGSSTVHAGSTFKIDDLTFSGTTSVESSIGQTPQSYALHQNYPNPFNPTTVINFDLPVSGTISLKVFDLLGREVATLVDGRMEAGFHQVTFDASRLTSGVYFYRIQAGSFSETKRLVLLK